MSHTMEMLVADLAAQAASVLDRWSYAKYAGPPAFVLAHGSPFVAQMLPKEYRRGRMQACFDNAFRLARRRGLVYVEGFATRADAANIPIHHAWCVEPGSDLVIDTTWDKGDLYYGVPFKLAYRRRQAGTVLDNWQEGWPLLRTETKESDWRYEPNRMRKLSARST